MQDGAHCGQCQRCIDVCPTGAIVGPYRLDARRCISYLTIELHGSIPRALRPLIGNRVYGCDDCQLVCPWNKFAQPAPGHDFDARNGLDGASLVELFAWSADEFEQRLQGSAIRRIGHERWLRNIAVALGNALRASAADGVDEGDGVDGASAPGQSNASNTSSASVASSAPATPRTPRATLIAALRSRADDASALVREHVQWALEGT